MQSFTVLVDEHDALTVLADRLSTIAMAEAEDAMAALLARGALASALGAHLQREGEFLYPDLLGGPFSDAVIRFERDFADLVALWSGYLMDWTASAIAADWRKFRGETVYMMDRLKQQISEENAILYPLAIEEERLAS